MLVDAIAGRRQLGFTYHGRPRVVEPQCYGIGHRGTLLLRGHQLRAGSQREPLYDVAKIERLAVLDTSFDRPGPNFRRDDSAMATIYAQLDPAD